ncbi:MAG: hypothetical protein M5E90_00650 [Asgard group archaeon]|nr:hypothetical protein [Asgard group archaeon]
MIIFYFFVSVSSLSSISSIIYIKSSVDIASNKQQAISFPSAFQYRAL